MKTVDVFGGIDGFENALGVHLFRKRELDENAVDAIVVVEVGDELQHFLGGDAGRRSVEPTVEAEMMAGFDFAFYIELRGGIVSDQDSGEAGANVIVDMHADVLGTDFSEDLVANFDAIE